MLATMSESIGRFMTQDSELCLREDTTAREEPNFAPVVEAEHAASPGDNVEDQLGVGPRPPLRCADIDGCAANFAQQDVPRADPELVSRITHRRRAVAATA